IAKLADLATGDERSPLFGAANAGVIARNGHLYRRDDETRSESYAVILSRAGLAEVEASGTGAVNPAAQADYAMHAHGAVFAEVKVDPDLGQLRVTRMVGAFAAHRQSQTGPQPAVRRDGLGHVLRAARRSRARPPLGTDHESESRRVPCAS